MTVMNPLDLYTLFVENVAGTMTIFFFLALIVIAYFSAKWRLNNITFIAIMALFLVFMSGFGVTTLLVTMIVVGGLITAWMLTRTTKT